MRPYPRLLPLVVACTLLSACDAADDATACEVVDVTARTWPVNGYDYNGTLLNNGRKLNAVSLNAKTWNGIHYNGAYDYNGISFRGLELQGTTLMGVDTDGVLHPIDLVGGTLLGKTDADELVELSIDAVEQDLQRADLTYYALSVAGENICGAGGRGLFVAGTWDETGAHDDAIGDDFSASFSCTDGVIAKCVIWGYTPYEVGSDAHQACTRLARADYCGDGVSYTRNGTQIDVFDQLGVLRPVDGPDDLRFEAGWGPDGAVCVGAPRFEMILPDGDALLPPCWDALPRCASEADAAPHGAVLANRSHGELRSVCEPESFRRPGRSK